MNPFASRIALIVGHTQKQQGAQGIHPIASSEYVYNTGLAELAAHYGRSRAHQVEIFFRDSGGIEAAYAAVAEWEADCAIELHFNAFNGQVAGTETLYSDDQDHKRVFEFEFATLVQQHMCRVFKRTGRGDRGLKKRPMSAGERGYFSVNQLFHIPSVLIEPFFGDNREEAKLAEERKQDLAECLVLAVEEWKKQLLMERESEVSIYTLLHSTPETASSESLPKGFHSLPPGSIIELSCNNLPTDAGIRLHVSTEHWNGQEVQSIPAQGDPWLSQSKTAKFVLKSPGHYNLYALLTSINPKVATVTVVATRTLPGKMGKDAPKVQQEMTLALSHANKQDRQHFQASVVDKK